MNWISGFWIVHDTQSVRPNFGWLSVNFQTNLAIFELDIFIFLQAAITRFGSISAPFKNNRCPLVLKMRFRSDTRVNVLVAFSANRSGNAFRTKTLRPTRSHEPTAVGDSFLNMLIFDTIFVIALRLDLGKRWSSSNILFDQTLCRARGVNALRRAPSRYGQFKGRSDRGQAGRRRILLRVTPNVITTMIRAVRNSWPSTRRRPVRTRRPIRGRRRTRGLLSRCHVATTLILCRTVLSRRNTLVTQRNRIEYRVYPK